MNISGFSREALDTVSALLYAEAGEQAAQPCPPKKPPEPKPPPQPPQPPQPRPVLATQQDPQVAQQKVKKPKCTSQPAQPQKTVSYSETLDFTRCVRPNGTAYGTGGKCRKGVEEKKPVEDKEEKSKDLVMAGKNVDIYEVEKKAESWRKKAGLEATPYTLDWSHDNVHALVHEFLGGDDKIGNWIGEGSKSPTVAEETLVNMVHRAAALKARGGNSTLTDRDLSMYFSRDIEFMLSRGDIPKPVKNLYYANTESGVNAPDVKKFITKYREMEATPGFDKLLDASHRVFVNAGDIFL